MTRVSEVMTKDVIHSVSSKASVEEAAKKMRQVRRGCLVIVEKGHLVGIVTERDIVQKAIAQGKSPQGTLVSEIMSKPVISVGPEALVSDAARVMADNKVRRLPVTVATEVVGMLTVTDMARYLQAKGRTDQMLAVMARASSLLTQT